MINEYLLEFDRVRRLASGSGRPFSYEFEHRRKLVRKFSWAIPNSEAIDAIVGLGCPVVEMGAGTGYWAALLAARGVRVQAFDQAPPVADCRNNHYHPGARAWFRVDRGSVEKLSVPCILLGRGASRLCGGRVVCDLYGADRRALMLCWPPYSDAFASDALKAFRGNLLVYIGEGAGGCTGDDAFHQMLDADWNFERNVAIPQWDGIHDSVMIYRRKRCA